MIEIPLYAFILICLLTFVFGNVVMFIVISMLIGKIGKING